MLFLLFPCCLCCWVVGYGLLGCWVLEDGARRPPSYFSLPSRMGSLCPILQQQARRTLTKSGVNLGRSQAKCGAKPCNKSGESLEKVGRKPWESHAASTVMNMENGRCSCSYRPLRAWRTTVVRRLFGPFRPIFGAYQKNNCLVSDNYWLAIIVLWPFPKRITASFRTAPPAAYTRRKDSNNIVVDLTIYFRATRILFEHEFPWII